MKTYQRGYRSFWERIVAIQAVFPFMVALPAINYKE
jgi:hypothetical protein